MTRPGIILLLLLGLFATPVWAATESDSHGSHGGHGDHAFPRTLESYGEPEGLGLLDTLVFRVQEEPFNLVATLLFLCAIVHTFLAGKFMHAAHHYENEHEKKLQQMGWKGDKKPVSFRGTLFHFLGEVEAIFGLWVVPLMVAILFMQGFYPMEHYIGEEVNFTEPMFVVIIMTIAATRPVLRLAGDLMGKVAHLRKGTPAAYWFSILTIGPVLGSFITEPAAMTICALLLAKTFYDLKPSPRLAYATLGLLFVNISVGGTLTNFAAPPVLMVASPARWDWSLIFMMTNFGWKAVLGILISTTLYAFLFKKELGSLARVDVDRSDEAETVEPKVPNWITSVHLFFLAWTVLVAHYPPLFIGGFLFFIGFTMATSHHQDGLQLKPALLVGFFLAGLVIHGGLQQWWIAPVLGSLADVPLFIGATILTAFNDNAAITYLATLVPGFTDTMKYAVVAGAVTGGGLTVIANAPNPAGQSILARYFPDGVNPLYLLLGALVPTLILAFMFMLIR